MNQKFRFGILGAGFSGSLLAWILAKQGAEVVLIDRGRHPRFAIGESSTPVADLWLSVLADRYGLQNLRPLSRWGSWQRQLPQLRAGKKRGFSYFVHQPDCVFSESKEHSSSWLVAASPNDELSDTHWMRSDVDQWFCDQAIKAGAHVLQSVLAPRVSPSNGGWEITGEVEEQPIAIQVDWLIDASNSTQVGEALGLARLDDRLQTQTGAMFGHFRGVGSMTQWLNQHLNSTALDPFDADDSAQHHILDHGWIWMLRFNDGTTSVGLVKSVNRWSDEEINAADRHEVLRQSFRRFPTVSDLMERSELVAPLDANQQPRVSWIPRISRLWDRAGGKNWLMLPTSAGIVDPLHSTGIAHALTGVARAVELLLCADKSRQASLAERYSTDVVHEVRWIDQLVNCCYQAADVDFDAFMAACSLYFVAAIHSERQLARDGALTDGFLLARQSKLAGVVHECSLDLQQLSRGDASKFVEKVREFIKPWNDVGLLDPSLSNRIARSIAPKT